MQKVVKRIFDVVCATLAIIVLAPVWIVLSVWIAVTSPGGIFFRQKRTGLDGKEFELLKFRSMYINRQADTLQATDNDNRITPIGHILRKSSLDELPQLINVIKGDMSIVGPRPHMIAHTQYYTPLIQNYMHRHRMRPGLTGLAQIRGFRGATPTLRDMENRVTADIEYIDNFSLWLDTRILLISVWKMATLKL